MIVRSVDDWVDSNVVGEGNRAGWSDISGRQETAASWNVVWQRLSLAEQSPQRTGSNASLAGIRS